MQRTKKKICNEEFQNLYSTLSITKNIKKGGVMDKGMLHAHRSSTKPTVMRQLGTHWHRRKNDIKTDIKSRM